MTIDWQFDQIQDLREDFDVEAKAAQGANGQGTLPNDHPHDLSKTLHELVEKKFLDSDGTGRGTYYFLPGCHPVSDDLLSEVEKLSDKGSELSHKLSDNEDLKQIAELVSSSERSSREDVKRVIVSLCGKAELSVQEMSEFLKRQEQTVRKYIDDLCQEGRLAPKFPVKTHPKQRYRSITGGGE